jgi:predicted GH43/DUF377 family glycosyl hydrolase
MRRLALPRKHGAWVLGPSYVPGTFDSHAVDCPFPFLHDGRFHLLFVGFDGRGYQTGIAESRDLVHWSRKRLYLGRGPAGSVTEHNIALTSVLRHNALFGSGELRRYNGEYIGAYHAYSRPGYEQGPAVIGIARSRDLREWTLEPPCLRPEDGAAWEHGGLHKSYLLEHRGTFYLFYNARNRSDGAWQEQIGLATSHDLVSWTRHPASPVVANGPRGAFDAVFASDPAVYALDDAWVMFYFGLGEDGHARDGVAVSHDLVTWTKAPRPVLEPGPAGSIDSVHAHKPGLVYHGGVLHHFYTAVAPEPAGRLGPIAFGERRGIALARY